VPTTTHSATIIQVSGARTSLRMQPG